MFCGASVEATEITDLGQATFRSARYKNTMSSFLTELSRFIEIQASIALFVRLRTQGLAW